MGLQSALSTALTGLTAAETSIDVAGNNVANANTVGFKESNVSFATQLLQTQSIGSGPSDNRGGTNPRQIGLGVKVAEISPEFTQGTIQISSNPLDLAIQGDGFFIVQGPQGNDDKLFTRNGQFKTNGDNEIVTTTGQRLLGYGVNDNFEIDTSVITAMTIPLGAAAVAQATETVFMSGPLDATAPIPTKPEIIESVVFSDGTFDVPTNTLDLEALSRPDEPTTIAANTSGSTVLVDDANYNYRITLVNANGQEGPPSDVLNINKTTGNSIDISGFPSFPSSDWTGYNIYRSNPGATDIAYHLVNSTPHTTGVFNDVSQDSAISSNALLNDTELETDSYSYYVTFYNGVDESQPTALSDTVTINSSTSPWSYLTNIPQPPPGGAFDRIRIYRNSEANPAVWRRLDTINAGQTEYVDNNTDASFNGEPEINLDGPAITSSNRVIDLKTRSGASYVSPFEVGTLEFTPDKGGRALGTSTFEITDETTVAQLVTFMEQAMGIVTTSQQADESSFDLGQITFGTESYGLGGHVQDSKIIFRSNFGKANAVGIDLSALQLTPENSTTAQAVSLAFNSIHEGTNVVDGEGSSSDFVVYDSLGSALSVRFTTVLEETTDSEARFRWIATSTDNQPLTGHETVVGTGLIITDHDGKFVSASSDQVAIDRTVSPASSPLQFTLDFNQVSGLDTGLNDVQASRQDGFPAGSLSSFFVTEGGTIQGVFSNGSTRALGQVLMARFANNAGLEQKGENTFSPGVNSGLPTIGAPGSKGLGSILAGSVELSNTDIGQNLIELITASTQYRGGARVITSVQQLLDELLSLTR